LIEKLSKPSGLTEDDKVKLASTVIQRAVRNGLTEVQVYRFPNLWWSDIEGGRRRHLATRPPHTYLKRIVTPPTAADNSAPTFGPLSCKITPLAFCN